ncbi:MAG: Ig-like domain-containing protein, partial [Gammaproteobacteria bacterium]|nr:Ig-like domain-containing protein [Gammaproteobacteria bacterium]
MEYRSLATDVFQLIVSGNQAQTSSSLAKWETQNLPDGGYRIRVIASDQLGHSKQHQVDITLDNTPPVVSLQMPQVNQKLSGSLKITAQASDPHLHQYQLKYTQDLPLTAKSEWELIQISAESLSASPAQIDDTWNSAAVFGSTLIRLLVQDRAGNQQTTDVMVDLENQTAKPGVQITQPQAKQVIKETLSIVGTVEEYGYSIIDNYQLSFGLGQKPSQWTSIHRGSSAVNANVLGSWDTREQKDGLYTLRLLAINGKGYQNSQTVEVTLDNSPPMALISPPNQEWIAGQRVEIRGTASDVNFDQYRLEYAKGSDVGSWSTVGTVTHQAVEQGILQTWLTTDLEDGQYQLKLIVTDQADNKTVTVESLTLDNRKPEVEITAPAEEEVVSGAIKIIGVITDDNLKDYQLQAQLVISPTGW